MLSFSKEQITLEYRDKKNLTGFIQITNHSDSSAYFKFKVNRPKFYLVKPDRGILLKAQKKKIQFVLHREGLSEALSDKFKCYYAFTSEGFNPQSSSGFEERPNTIKQRLLVRITNLPSGVQLVGPPGGDQKGSELKSMGASGAQFQTILKQKNSSSLQNLVKQKQDRVILLKREIETMQSDKLRTSAPSSGSSNSKKSSVFGIMLLGIFAVGLGIISSLFV